jgi:rhodanese-related sulfurtransferase
MTTSMVLIGLIIFKKSIAFALYNNEDKSVMNTNLKKGKTMAIKNVDATTLKQWIDCGEAVIVDVREPAENAAQSIPGATLLPLGKFHKNALPPSAGKKLVIHCHSGKRSMNACEKLLAEDPDFEVYNLEGGISAWSALGQPITSSGKFCLPLDRQVQLTIGLILVIGSLLAFIFSPAWLLLTGFIGAGLVFTGLTGFCGLAIVMAKMPWNQKIKSKASCCVK